MNAEVTMNSIWDNYQNLTPKNQRRFREDLMQGLAINTKNHVYNILHEKVTISPVMEEYIGRLFEKYYRQQIESVQL